jgi:uncharacterized repeat protein (TIGR03803 family)
MKNSNLTTMLVKIPVGAACHIVTIALLLPAAVVVALPSSAWAQTATLTVLHDFNTLDGSYPTNGLLLASDGNFYGTAPSGGSAGYGTAYRVTSAGDFTTLVNFTVDNGAQPFAPLIQGSDGNLYGTTAGGINGPTLDGTIFKMTTAGDLTTLFVFDQADNQNGISPEAALVQGIDGNFYGTTVGGGTPNIQNTAGFGTIFEMSPAGDLLQSVTVHGSNGEPADPRAPLIQASNGNFYGTSYEGGGDTNAGSIFEFTPAGVVTVLHGFTGGAGNTGDRPYDGLLQGSDGNFYGTTEYGGSAELGTVFKVTPGGDFTVLVNFTGPNGAQPFASLIQAADGNFYGTASLGGSDSLGTIFRITPAGVFTTIYNFSNNEALGAFPRAALVQGSDGNLYGTTMAGGTSGVGTVFRLDLNLPNPLTLLSAASVKGGFAIDLPLSGTPGIEDRRSSGGTYSLTFTFSNNLTSVASVASTCGTVVSGVIDGTNPHQFIVSLTGVLCNAQDVTVTLTNVQDDQSNTLASASATMGLLLGDVDGDGSVTMADVNLVRASRGQTADPTNFRRDINPDGTINHKDVSRARHSVGTSLP